jgi:hypothetical protein
MGPEVRTALLLVGIVFCLGFTAMTLAAAAESGFGILTLLSLGIVALIGVGLIGAIRNPPDE